MPRRAIVNWTLPGMAGELIYRLRRGHLRPSSQSLLNAGARFWEGEPPGEPRHHPARTDFGLRRAQSSRELSRAEPRPPGITQGRSAAVPDPRPEGFGNLTQGAALAPLRMEAEVTFKRPYRDQAWSLAFILTMVLILGHAPARAQQPATADWVGKRVIQRFNNFPLRLDGEAVLRSGMEIHIYRVTRTDGERLWLEGEDGGPAGWGSPDQFIRVEDAPAYLAGRVRAHPNDAFLYSLSAVIHADRKELDRTVDDWTKIVELEPDNAESYIGRAKLWLNRAEWDKAITDLTQAIRIEPNDAYCYRLRAHAWNAKHDYDKVIADCGKSIELEPRNATGLITRAQAWLAKNEYDKAIADATAGIALDADEPLAYLWRGLAWSRKKDFDKAIADYSDAIRLAPKDPQLYYNRAWAWQQKGNHARGRGRLRGGRRARSRPRRVRVPSRPRPLPRRPSSKNRPMTF